MSKPLQVERDSQGIIIFKQRILKFIHGPVTGEVDNFKFQPIIRLWKTGNITSGALSGQIAAFIAYTAQYGGGSQVSNIPIYAGSGSITQVACSITTPNLVFPIGDVLASSFGSSIGTTPANASNIQNLGLNCDAGANINVALNGTQNPDVGTTSILALTNREVLMWLKALVCSFI